MIMEKEEIKKKLLKILSNYYKWTYKNKYQKYNIYPLWKVQNVRIQEVEKWARNLLWESNKTMRFLIKQKNLTSNL